MTTYEALKALVSQWENGKDNIDHMRRAILDSKIAINDYEKEYNFEKTDYGFKYE